METLVISTHLDDAVLSVGKWLANAKGSVTVATIFAGIPQDRELLTPYDEKCGFQTSRAAMVARREEDIKAMSVLRCRTIHLAALDSQYEDKPSKPLDWMALIVRGYDRVVGPIGMMHPDHIAVGDAMFQLNRYTDAEIIYYSDLPYRIMKPGDINYRAREFDLHITSAPDPYGPSYRKLRALRAYKSQWGHDDLVPDKVMVNEQFWVAK